MERDAVIGVSGGLAQIRGHFRNEIDGPRAAQNARRAAAAEFRVSRLVLKLNGQFSDFLDVGERKAATNTGVTSEQLHDPPPA